MTSARVSSDVPERSGGSRASARRPPLHRRRRLTAKQRILVGVLQICVLAAFLLCWQYLPTISGLQHQSHLFDRFFVSSPTKIARREWDLFTGHHQSVRVWMFAWHTLWSSLIGTAIGMSLGAAAGLVLSNFAMLSAVFRPFVIVANAIPRIALIPVIILLFGITFKTSVVVAVLVVFFVAFFNAYEGGTTISPELVNNAWLLGAGTWRLLWNVRLPFVLAWTFAALPLAVTFAIISVVTADLLTGYKGMGYLLATATQSLDATLTFAVVVVLALMGLVVVVAAELVRNRVLHWWGR